jgi:hypothetical protein
MITTSTTETAAAVITSELSAHEVVIERGYKTFIEVGNALAAIRDGRLYRQHFATFEDYCKQRWSLSRSRAYRLIEGADVVDRMLPIGDKIVPSTESQARELAGLTPRQCAIVMRVAHENSGGKITAAAIRAARAQPWTPAEITTALDGYLIHPAAAIFPAFTKYEWEGFAASVGKFGLIRSIALSPDGTQIVDGRFRYLALRWNGIDPATTTTLGGDPALTRLDPDHDELDIVDFVIAMNVKRHHYTEGQHACIAVGLMELEELSS